MAFMKAMDLPHRAMCAVLYRRTDTTIVIVSKVDTYCIVVFFCRHGSRRGNTEQVVVRWRRLVAFMKAMDLLHWIGQCARYCTIASPWLSKWPAMEVHLFVVAASFVCSNVAKRSCYGPFKLTPSYYYYIHLVYAYLIGCRRQQWTPFWPSLSPADEPEFD